MSNKGTVSTTEDFSFDNEDGYGIIEIWFGDVSTSANDTLFKIETTDYKNFTETGWANMEFKTNGSNEFYGRYNNGTNDVIPVIKDGRISGTETFGHGYPTNPSRNPAGYYTNTGRYGYRDDIGIARDAAGTAQNWNNANANYVPSSTVLTAGFVNDHYFNRSWDAMLIHKNNKECEEAGVNTGYAWAYYAYKCGPEILNGGSFSISSGDHIMINVKRQSVDYYKNGSIVHTQSNSGYARVGGVVHFQRKLVIGSSSNDANSTFTLKKIKWHGNSKSSADALTIFQGSVVPTSEIVETVHTFIHDGSGNNYTTHSITFNEPTECDVLIVGGGGAGGSDTGGGGGGGQVLYYTNDNVSFKTGNSIILNGTYDINVGNGGGSHGADGYNTVISHNSSDIYIAGGGGGGGTAHTSNALSSPLGGGGGGNSGNSANKNGAISTGGGGQGGISGPSRGGGGGGGANIGSSSNGGNVNGSVTGSGGTGVDINITGESFGVGGGGSGGSYLSSSASSGSVSHGGGQGGIGSGTPSVSGTNNTGGGGGGTGYSGSGLGKGGSGIVIIYIRT